VFPDWSASGKRIAYQRSTHTDSRVLIIRPTGHFVDAFGDASGDFDHEEIVAGDSATSALDPDWTPNATQLVYACGATAPPFGQDICSTTAAGPHTPTTLVSASNLEQFPAVSPDGDELVWDVGPEKGDTELKRRLVSGGPVTTLTSNSVVDEEADWGPRAP
jgi:Tol biopolymer transport system component